METSHLSIVILITLGTLIFNFIGSCLIGWTWSVLWPYWKPTKSSNPISRIGLNFNVQALKLARSIRFLFISDAQAKNIIMFCRRRIWISQQALYCIGTSVVWDITRACMWDRSMFFRYFSHPVKIKINTT